MLESLGISCQGLERFMIAGHDPIISTMEELHLSLHLNCLGYRQSSVQSDNWFVAKSHPYSNDHWHRYSRIHYFQFNNAQTIDAYVRIKVLAAFVSKIQLT